MIDIVSMSDLCWMCVCVCGSSQILEDLNQTSHWAFNYVQFNPLLYSFISSQEGGPMPLLFSSQMERYMYIESYTIHFRE